MSLNKRSSAISSIIVTLIAFGNVEGVRAQSANVEALKAQVRERNQRNLEEKRQAQKRQADAESAALAARISQQQREQAAAAATLKREQAAAAAAEAASVAKDVARAVKISKMNKEEYDAFVAAEKKERNNQALADYNSVIEEMNKEKSDWVKKNGKPEIQNLSCKDISENSWIKYIVTLYITDRNYELSHCNSWSQNEPNYLRKQTYDDDSLIRIQRKLDNIWLDKRNFVDGFVETINDYGFVDTEIKGIKKSSKNPDFVVMCKDLSTQEYSEYPPYCVGHGGYLKLLSRAELYEFNRVTSDRYYGTLDFPKRSIENPTWLRRPQADDFSSVYPDAAQWSGIEGTTVILCIVSTNGSLEDCRALGQTPKHFEFSAAALKLSKLWKIAPLVVDGTPVAARWKARIRWSIVGPTSSQ